jgi:hypothetical protein
LNYDLLRTELAIHIRSASFNFLIALGHHFVIEIWSPLKVSHFDLFD